MQYYINFDLLAHVVSAKLGQQFVYQEDCGKSDTCQFLKLRSHKDIHQKILVCVFALVTGQMDQKFEQALLKRKWMANISFLEQAAKYDFHSLCPKVLGVGEPTQEFGFHWIAYEQVAGWPISKNWSQFRPEIRREVVSNLATFVRQLALAPPVTHSNDNPSVDYVGSVSADHVLYSPALVANSIFYPSDEQLKNIKSHAGLVSLLAEAKEGILRLRFTKSLAADQLHAMIPVVTSVLRQPAKQLLAHLNLHPQNIWIEPFSGKLTAIFGWEFAHYAPTWMATAPPPWLMDEKTDLILNSELLDDPWKVWRPDGLHSAKGIGREMRRLRTTWETLLRSKEDRHPFSQVTLAYDEMRRRATKICLVEVNKLGQGVEWARKVVLSSVPAWKHNALRSFLILAAAVAGITWYTQDTHGRERAILSAEIMTIGVVILSFSLSVPQFGRYFAARSTVNLDTQIASGMLIELDKMVVRRRFPSASGYDVEREKLMSAPQLEAVACSPANSIIPDAIFFAGTVVERTERT